MCLLWIKNLPNVWTQATVSDFFASLFSSRHLYLFTIKCHYIRSAPTEIFTSEISNALLLYAWSRKFHDRIAVANVTVFKKSQVELSIRLSLWAIRYDLYRAARAVLELERIWYQLFALWVVIFSISFLFSHYTFILLLFSSYFSLLSQNFFFLSAFRAINIHLITMKIDFLKLALFFYF